MARHKANGWEALRMMLRVIHALMLRETKTRYGRLQIGYLWAFLEPIFFILILSFIFSYARMFTAINMPNTQFFMTGILSYILFRDIATQTMTAIRPNLQLLYFPQVQVFDLGAARALLETATFFVVLSLLTLVIAYTGLEPVRIDDPLRLVAAVIMIALLGYGVGTAAGALVPLFPSAQFLIQSILIRPLFFLSGVFFTADMIPDEIRGLVLLNPMLHLIELMRSAFFVTYESDYINYPYLIFMVLLSLFSGLLMQRALRRHAFRI